MSEGHTTFKNQEAYEQAMKGAFDREFLSLAKVIERSMIVGKPLCVGKSQSYMPHYLSAFADQAKAEVALEQIQPSEIISDIGATALRTDVVLLRAA